MGKADRELCAAKSGTAARLCTFDSYNQAEKHCSIIYVVLASTLNKSKSEFPPSWLWAHEANFTRRSWRHLLTLD